MDRRWMLADADGNFLSQRQLSVLSQFQPEFHDDLLITHIPSGEEMRIDPEKFQYPAKVQVWGSYFKAHATDDKINQWFSDILEEKVTLIYMADDDIRNIKPPDDNGIVSFADGYPALLTTEASLQDLNNRMTQPVAMDRFRANIVIDGDNPFEEDDWKEIKIGAIGFRNAKRSARCKVINIDQQSGISSSEPLKTLSTFRRQENKVYFGINLIPLDTGIIHEGDEVVITV